MVHLMYIKTCFCGRYTKCSQNDRKIILRSRHRDINSIEEPLFDKDKTSILNRNKLLI